MKFASPKISYLRFFWMIYSTIKPFDMLKYMDFRIGIGWIDNEWMDELVSGSEPESFIVSTD